MTISNYHNLERQTKRLIIASCLLVDTSFDCEQVKLLADVLVMNINWVLTSVLSPVLAPV